VCTLELDFILHWASFTFLVCHSIWKHHLWMIYLSMLDIRSAAWVLEKFVGWTLIRNSCTFLLNLRRWLERWAKPVEVLTHNFSTSRQWDHICQIAWFMSQELVFLYLIGTILLRIISTLLYKVLHLSLFKFAGISLHKFVASNLVEWCRICLKLISWHLARGWLASYSVFFVVTVFKIL